MARHEKDRCEKCNKAGRNFTFVAHVVNPKTGTKGMLLCPKHEMEAQRYHDGTAIN